MQSEKNIRDGTNIFCVENINSNICTISSVGLLNRSFSKVRFNIAPISTPWSPT
jgi:hypothetical protein